MNSYIKVGRIGAPYGIKGWLKVNSFTNPKDNIITYDPWFLWMQGQWQQANLEKTKQHGKGVVIKLAGIDERNAAMRYTNIEIAIERKQLAKLTQNEYYWADLEGLTVINKNGMELGIIDHLFATGSNDVIAVKGSKQHLIPYLRGSVVLEIDLTAKTMLVDWDSDF